MKTKTIFMLAAMLLMSIGAFAQNNEPLEGDVNNDGTVDVADIVKVIDIMQNGGGIAGQTKCYWYVGLTQPTTTNYESIASIVESYKDSYEYTPESRGYVYVLVTDDKNITIVDPALNATVDIIVDTSTISGYKIYKSAIKLSGLVIINVS